MEAQETRMLAPQAQVHRLHCDIPSQDARPMGGTTVVARRRQDTAQWPTL